MNSVEGAFPKLAHTVEAYACGLANILSVFSADLLRMEEELTAQKTIFTLSSLLLSDELTGWRRRLSYLHQLHLLAVPDTTPVPPNWLAAVRIISVLYSALVGALFPELLTCLMDLFLRSVRPYFRQGSFLLSLV